MRHVSFVLLTLSMLALYSCSGDVRVSTSDEYQLVELPDGSRAYLNHDSEIRYATEFTERKIEQAGEVFYAVVKGDAPFTVHTDRGEVVVLGTAFNVKAEAQQLEVEVEKGVVELRADGKKLAKKIERGQKAVFREVEEGIQVAKAEFQYKAWIKQLNAELKKAGRELKREAKEFGKEMKKINQDVVKDLKRAQ